MQVLLDTNVLIWLAGDNPRINQIKELICAENIQPYVSTVSWWEIAIKVRIGKLPFDMGELRHFAGQCCFEELPITNKYIDAYRELPHLHRDPFDHMLLAQAITEPMRLITGDAVLAEYSSLVMAV